MFHRRTSIRFSRDGDRLLYLLCIQLSLGSVSLTFVQGADPYSGGGGDGGALGGVRSATPRAAGGAAGGQGLDDLSLSSVSSTLASFFLFLAILRYCSFITLFGWRMLALTRCSLRLRAGPIQNAIAGRYLYCCRSAVRS